jgi:hypothetical protein
MARKQTTIIQCDNPTCKTVAEVAELKETPEGWYKIQQADIHFKTNNIGFDLCSLKCIEKWAKERKALLGTVLPEENTSSLGHIQTVPKTVCGICDEPVDSRGLRVHVISHVKEGVVTQEEATELTGVTNFLMPIEAKRGA